MSDDGDHRDYDFNRLCDAISKLPSPPCESCQFASVCTTECKSFAIYVLTGKRVQPPTAAPWEREG
jgi:radical SAM protein with 4Fe4S-binding SPASM domain